jgi:hypothetical protein
MARACSALAVAALLATITATGSTAAPQSGVLSGTWVGVLSGSVNGTTRHEKIRLVINSGETGGSWRVSAACHGRLTLDSISGGSHHYRRHLASGGSCHGGDIDCLWREGTKIYDNITPRPGGWSRNGYLRRARS